MATIATKQAPATKPATAKPATAKPATAKPATAKPATAKPAAPAPTVAKPALVASNPTVVKRSAGLTAAATAAKAAKLQATGATPASCGGYAATQAIKLVTGVANPHRAGSYRYSAFAAVAKSSTVGDYALTGFKAKYLRQWAVGGLIRIV